MNLRHAAAVATAAVLALSVACSGDEEKPPRRSTTTTTSTQVSAQFTIAELLPLDAQFTTYLRIATSGEVLDLLDGKGEDGPGKVTLIAPSEAAFESYGAGNVDALAADPAAARAFARSYVLDGVVTYQDLLEAVGGTVTTVDGEELEVAAGEAGGVTVGGATVVKRDIAASNGTIHVVDSVRG